MLDSVRIRNFRCLKDVEVPLKPLTVLIGPNDSGKSAFLGGLCRLAGLPGKSKFDYWRGESQRKIITDGFEDGRKVGPGDSVVSPTRLFELPSSGVETLSGGLSDDAGPPELGQRGEHVPALLDYLLRRNRGLFYKFVKALCRLAPGVENVDVATPRADQRRIDLVIENDLCIPADRASVGVRLLIFFLALAYHPLPPKLILLEEPENGIHPRRLGEIMKLLREITKGKHGDHAAQIVLTTHSPYLLDFVDVKTDQILVFQRNDDGSRSAEPIDKKKLKIFLDEFKPGEVWFNEGEKGLV